MRTIALINQKGGVGKTTCAVNIGAGLRRLNRRTLLIDLDPQAHLTYSLGLRAHEMKSTVYGLLRREAGFRETLQEKDGLHIIPSSLDLAGAEMELSGVAGREFLLREALEGLKGYDFILIDCPPSLGILTLNALTTAREVFIILQTELLALQGMGKLLETVEIVQKRLNPALRVSGIIGTRFDSRKRLNREVIEKIREYFGEKLFSTVIRDNVSVAEAPGQGLSIFDYRPDAHGAEDYLNLCKEIIGREHGKG